MPLLKPDKQEKLVTVTAKFPESLKDEVEAYLKFTGLKSMNEFLNKSANLIVLMDKDWKRAKRSKHERK